MPLEEIIDAFKLLGYSYKNISDIIHQFKKDNITIEYNPGYGGMFYKFNEHGKMSVHPFDKYMVILNQKLRGVKINKIKDSINE